MLRNIVDKISKAGVANTSSGDGLTLEAFLKHDVASRNESKVAPAKPAKRSSLLGSLFGGGHSKESQANGASVEAAADAMMKPESTSEPDLEHGPAHSSNGQADAPRESENNVAEKEKAGPDNSDELQTLSYALAPENEPSFLARAGLDRHEEITDKLVDLGLVSAEDLALALGSGALDLSTSCNCTPSEEEEIALALDALDQSLGGRLSTVINAGAPPKRVSLVAKPAVSAPTKLASISNFFVSNSGNQLPEAEVQRAKDEKAAAAEEARLAKEKEKQQKEEERKLLAEKKAKEKKEREEIQRAEKAKREAAASRAKEEDRKKKEEQMLIYEAKKKAEEEAKKAKANALASRQKTDLRSALEHGRSIESSAVIVEASSLKVEVSAEQLITTEETAAAKRQSQIEAFGRAALQRQKDVKQTTDKDASGGGKDEKLEAVFNERLAAEETAAAKRQSQIEAFGRAALQRQKDVKQTTDKDASGGGKDEKLEAVFNERLAAEGAQNKANLSQSGVLRIEIPSSVRARGQSSRMSLDPTRTNINSPTTTGGGKGSGRGSAPRASVESISDQARGPSVSRAPKRPSVMSGRGAGRASMAGSHAPSPVGNAVPPGASSTSSTAMRTIRERSPPRPSAAHTQGNDRVSGASPPRAVRPAPRKSTRSPPRPPAADERSPENGRVSGASPPRAVRPAPRMSTRSPPRPPTAE